MAEIRPRLCLTDEALKEITRRTTQDELAPSWAQYLLLIQMASGLLERAPRTLAECEDQDIEERIGEELEQIISTLHRLLPGGLKEAWSYYLPNRETQS